MDEDQLAILSYLSENAIGYDNRKSSEEIRLSCALITGGPTNDYVRGKIRDMVFNHDQIIGSISWDRGYWIIQNEEELNRVVESLQARANKVLERSEKLIENWENINNG